MEHYRSRPSKSTLQVVLLGAILTVMSKSNFEEAVDEAIDDIVKEMLARLYRIIDEENRREIAKEMAEVIEGY